MLEFFLQTTAEILFTDPYKITVSDRIFKFYFEFNFGISLSAIENKHKKDYSRRLDVDQDSSWLIDA